MSGNFAFVLVRLVVLVTNAVTKDRPNNGIFLLRVLTWRYPSIAMVVTAITIRKTREVPLLFLPVPIGFF